MKYEDNCGNWKQLAAKINYENYVYYLQQIHQLQAFFFSQANRESIVKSVNNNDRIQSLKKQERELILEIEDLDDKIMLREQDLLREQKSQLERSEKIQRKIEEQVDF